MEIGHSNFIVAVAFVTAIIILIIGMYGYHLVSSGNRIRKAQKLSAAVIDYTPVFIMIVCDDEGIVTAFSARDDSLEKQKDLFIGKKLSDLHFLPAPLKQHALNSGDNGLGSGSAKFSEPLDLPGSGARFIEWEVQDFLTREGKTEFCIVTGADQTDLLRQKRKLQELAKKLETTEEQERERIADDLHHHIGATLRQTSDAIHALKKKDLPEDISRGLDNIRQTVDAFTRGTHTLIFDLTPHALYSVGLGAALEHMISQFQEQYRLHIRLENNLPDDAFSKDLAIFLFKAVREFVSNALKHGGADEILIKINQIGEDIEASVEDNGPGFSITSDELLFLPESGFGLFSIKNRIELHHGKIILGQSDSLGGGRVVVKIPESTMKKQGSP